MTAAKSLGIVHPKHLFIFGLGYTGTRLAHSLIEDGWNISGTVRSHEKAAKLRSMGIRAHVFTGSDPDSDTLSDLIAAPFVLQSVGLVDGHDPILPLFGPHLHEHKTLRWMGYLSTTVVYGNHDGALVDEQTKPIPQTPRGIARLAAEKAWADQNLPLNIFRLAGIYGPGRNILLKILNGKARTVIKLGQVFSRIHVDDIVGLIRASMDASTGRLDAPEIYNGADNLTASPQDVNAYAANLLGYELPPTIQFQDADLSPMARSFYADNKRVSNAKMRALMGPLRYPTYREGLTRLAKDLSLS